MPRRNDLHFLLLTYHWFELMPFPFRVLGFFNKVLRADDDLDQASFVHLALKLQRRDRIFDLREILLGTDRSLNLGTRSEFSAAATGELDTAVPCLRTVE